MLKRMVNQEKDCDCPDCQDHIKELEKNLDSKYRRSINSNIPEIIEMDSGSSKSKLQGAWTPKHILLASVEEYLLDRIKKENIELAYDVTAKEPLYFQTINYTTFAGCIILHPLNFEQSIRQMTDAYAEQKNVGHIDFLKKTIEENKTFSKYKFAKVTQQKAKKALVVLPGGNKLKKHCCVGKIERILNKHGVENVLFKKHPISHNEAYDELDEYLGGIYYANDSSNLFDLIKNSEYIYSTMISESALIGYMLNKKVDHFDLLQNRDTTSYGHINYFLYSTKDPLEWAQTCFASHKSGVIHPVVDSNWKDKIDQYIDYIKELREYYKYAYV
tara:strand:+ start:288 stop:1280 length:993 start_codon:yes stop_codon:yes gene_type:complete